MLPSIFLYICYIILLSIGGVTLGKDFFLKSIYGAFLQPTIVFILEQIVPSTYFVNTISNPTSVLFVSMIFAAILYGSGMGFMFKHNATTGGMDAVQKIINKYTKLPLSLCIYITDGIVIMLGIFTFGIEKGAFALVTMFLCGKIVDLVSIGNKAKKTVYIITKAPQAVKEIIYLTINRGVTELKVYGGYTLEEKRLLLCVLSNREYIKVKDEIYKIDPEAFVFLSDASEVLGRGFSMDKFIK